jgi:delta24-sterol reductase
MPFARSDHTARVAAVAGQVRSRPTGSKLTIRKKTPSHSVRDPKYKTGLHAVDVSGLTAILSIDEQRMTVTAEGQVTMGELAAATFARGLLPAVVPEYRKFTVSGLINGEGIQSSSHRYGVFTHTLVEVELLKADGTTITASQTSEPELFATLPESLGTLGIVTAATIRLVRARPYVRCTYQRFTTLEQYVSAYRASLGGSDFHEGVVFGPNLFVLLTGDFVDDPGGLPVRDPEVPGSPYFFQHVRESAKCRAVTQEVMATLSYLARCERGHWWMAECIAGWPMLSGTRWGRKHIDRAAARTYEQFGFGSRDLTPHESNRCIINQDMGVRIERLGEGIRWVQQWLDVYPIWNCAVRVPEALRAALQGSTHLVDLGTYGEPMNPGYRYIRDLRALQKMADQASLWGTSYLTWEEIVAAQPERYARYERVRQVLQAEAAFLHIRDKVVWVDPSTPDEGKIPLFRMYRAFGRRWYLNPLAYLTLIVAATSQLIWRKP